MTRQSGLARCVYRGLIDFFNIKRASVKKKSGKEYLSESGRVHFARFLFLPIESSHNDRAFSTGTAHTGLHLDSATKCKL